MPLFDYKCPRGHQLVEPVRADEINCTYSDCHEIARRRFSFSIKTAVPAHYNHAVGAYVRNEQDVKDALKRAAEKQYDALGYSSDFTYLNPADMSEATHLGVTEEGMDSTRRRWHDAEVLGVPIEQVPILESPSD